ncbi:MAG: hypothetical protein ABIJ31_04130 [Pseudomonadota bacterium]
MDKKIERKTVFRVRALFMVIFYGLLLAWTVATVPLIYQKFQQGGWFMGDWLYAFMIAFFYLFTWFWSLGLFYSVSLDFEGQVVLKSLRRRLELPAIKIRSIEGSRFSRGFGFIKLKLPWENGYLFCHGRNKELDEIIAGIQKKNPLLKMVRI